MTTLLLGLLACWGDRAYIVEGTVVEVHGPDEVVVAHEDIPNLMPAMVMPFKVAEPAMLEGVHPGSRIIARYELLDDGSRFTRLRVVGQGEPPATKTGPFPARPGEALPPYEIPLDDGTTLVLGPDQSERVALTFVYTRCPIPEFCPAMMGRLQALEAALGEGEGRLVAVTLDPAHDALPVLAAWGAEQGAGPRLRYGRVEPDVLADLAMSAGLPVSAQEDGTIGHGLRLLVLDRKGRLIERYDDARFPLDRVVSQLGTGEPLMPPGNSGTVTPEEAP
ncbi:MAG: copper-binding protein [Alphaproteobacteria bacterium]|nr:copper-binding protein [Alphaproteobacteria bacterium]